MTNKKITTVERLSRRLKKTKKRVVFTNGCFDILHYGHVKYLQKAKSKADLLVIGLNSDKSARRLKGEMRPITPEGDRAGILAALEAVDYVVIFPEDTPYRLIRALKPDVLVKGADWSKKDIVGSDFVESYGGKVLTIPYIKNRSTTNIIKKITQSH